MGARTLFGVPVPDGAVRVVIRPILGRGGAIPLYEATLEEGAIPSDTDVIVAASRCVPFWEYIDAQVKKKRIAPSDAESEWKLRLQFFNQTGQEEGASTETAFEFYRSTSASKADDDSPEARAFERGILMLERLADAQEKAALRITESAAEALREMVKAAADSIAKSAEAGSKALSEATKQTSQVSDLAKALLEETGNLKRAVFGLQTERAQASAEPPRSMAQDLKDIMDVGRTLVGMADSLAGSVPKEKPAPDAPKPVETTDDGKQL